MRKWLLQPTHCNLQGILCAAVTLQMDNSLIFSLEFLIKPRLKSSAPREENICEIYLFLLESHIP